MEKADRKRRVREVDNRKVVHLRREERSQELTRDLFYPRRGHWGDAPPLHR
ncbi:hypothetical protein [Streptomyces sp. NPDC045251]|uniref:hypothetical protein n=1 Tax=unclassified Streptomyces TaxID=2593676 RepID=UPI0033D59235